MLIFFLLGSDAGSLKLPDRQPGKLLTSTLQCANKEQSLLHCRNYIHVVNYYGKVCLRLHFLIHRFNIADFSVVAAALNQ